MILYCPNVGITYTRGIQLQGQIVGRAGLNILSGLCSESVSAGVRMLILGRILIRGNTSVMS